jgi:hypothetical protein
LNAECEGRNDRRRAKWLGGNNRLSQLSADNGNCELALRLELADGARVGIMCVLDRCTGMEFSRRIVGCACPRSGGKQLVFVLASQQMVQALSEQHHPRVEDEHAGYESWFRAPQHGGKSGQIKMRNSVASATKLRLWRARFGLSTIFGREFRKISGTSSYLRWRVRGRFHIQVPSRRHLC